MNEPDENIETTPNPHAGHEITVIGCIKGTDGWHMLGFDENTKTLVPLEKIP